MFGQKIRAKALSEKGVIHSFPQKQPFGAFTANRFSPKGFN
jgi:hypothetical protein